MAGDNGGFNPSNPYSSRNTGGQAGGSTPQQGGNDFNAAPPTQQRPQQRPQQYIPQQGQQVPQNYQSNPFDQGQPVPAGTAYGSGYGAGYGQQDGGETSGNGGRIAIIVIIVLALLALLGVVGYMVFGKTSHSESASPKMTAITTPTQEATTQAAPPTTTAAPARPEHPQLPAGAQPANQAAMNNEPAGNFNNVYNDSQMTSAQFATIVRDEYVKQYVATGNLNATVTAYSPVTGGTYTMDCRDNGQYVTCTGGDNAIVYIA